MQNIYPTVASAASPRPSIAAPAVQGQDGGQDKGQDKGKGFGFLDLIDVVNPLHHIPVVGHIYRKLSGDSINPAMRIGGGALFGGPLGAAFAAGGLVLEQLIDDAGAGRPVPPVEAGGRPAPGGWMVAASRPVQPYRHAPNATLDAQKVRLADAPPTPRRGGWMAAAAYAMTDELAAGRPDPSASTLKQVA